MDIPHQQSTVRVAFCEVASVATSNLLTLPSASQARGHRNACSLVLRFHVILKNCFAGKGTRKRMFAGLTISHNFGNFRAHVTFNSCVSLRGVVE